MKEDRIINALGQVKDEYILEAAPKAGREKHHAFRGLAAALAIVLLGTLFLQTAPGAAAAEYVAEKVSSLIQTLFPPKEITIMVEGAPVEGQYSAVGQEPEAGETGADAVPGFAIYIDSESYTMTEENGVTIIRPVNFSPDLPTCGMDIVHLPDITVQEAAEAAKAEIPSDWEVSETEAWSMPDSLSFFARSGWEWDSACKQVFLIPDGQQGVFQATIQYFFEAAEGHGVRLLSMLHTFTLIPEG